MFVDAGSLATRLLFVGCLIEAAEGLRLRSTFSDVGMFSRRTVGLLATTPGIRPTLVGYALKPRGAEAAISVAMVAQIVAAVTVLLVGTEVVVGVVAALACLCTGSYLRFRRGIGGNGADQLTEIALITFALVVIAGRSTEARLAGDFFLAGQVCLAYFAAGVAKMVSPVWRHCWRACHGRLRHAGSDVSGQAGRRCPSTVLEHYFLGVPVSPCSHST
jgi:hypothetical protein